MEISFFKPEFAEWALVSSPPQVISSALAVKDTDWTITYGHFWKRAKQLDTSALNLVLNALGTIIPVSETYWHKTTGFQPRVGALGLTKARLELGLRFNDNTILWLIFGSPSLYGEYILPFNKTERDANTSPHPMSPPVKIEHTDFWWYMIKFLGLED